MAKLKTIATTASVEEYLNKVEPEEKRKDSFAILNLMEKVTGEKAVMWGPSIIGFGKYHYKSERSKQEGDWPLTGFSPRKLNLTLYTMPSLEEDKTLFEKLGKHKTSVGCLYIKKLADVDMKVLEKLIENCYINMKKMNSVK